ncbi:MAG: response regulator [Verrucomicrobia bacterium]|nr:response regulator [Verrucomicrobiota bacterium]
MITLLITGAAVVLIAIISFAFFQSGQMPTPGAKHAQPTILVIDDNVSVLNMVRLGLEEERYTVFTAANPQQGIELFRQHSKTISLVLLDFRMPEMSGDQVFDCLQKINSEVPVMLITGFCDDISAADNLRNKVRGYLIKPFQLGDLIGKVREVVSMS